MVKDAESEPRRQRRYAETRQRLISAALRLVIREGGEALTTVQLTQAAGIAQSGFYRYFDGVEACLTAAVEPVAERVLEEIADSRNALYSVMSEGIGRSAAHYQTVLELATAEPDIARLLVTHRFEKSPVGRVMTRVVDSAVADLVHDIEALGAARGLSLVRENVEVSARIIVVAVLGGIEERLERPNRSTRLIGEALAQMCKAVIAGLFDAAQGP